MEKKKHQATLGQSRHFNTAYFPKQTWPNYSTLPSAVAEILHVFYNLITRYLHKNAEKSKYKIN